MGLNLPTFAWSRPLSASERAFLTRFFGETLPLQRLRIARSIHPGRCWSPYGARISLTANCFEANDPARPVDLTRPTVAATLAHEALHVWQRCSGRRVTLEGALLQVPYTLFKRNPYAYETSGDPEALLAAFLSGNVEQQGQIFEDYVRDHQRGLDVARFSHVASHVESGGLVSRV